MWGKAKRMLAANEDAGITPTHVGKSPFTFPINFVPGDHPHPCGEKKGYLPVELSELVKKYAVKKSPK